jgi:hypothetical protein
MEKTANEALKLTEAGFGRHHIGDFLPPEELSKFMAKVSNEEAVGTFRMGVQFIIKRGSGSATPYASPPPWPSIFPVIILSTTLSTRTTGISLHLRWPLTSQSHGSVLKNNNRIFLLRIKLHAQVSSFIIWKTFCHNTVLLFIIHV